MPRGLCGSTVLAWCKYATVCSGDIAAMLQAFITPPANWDIIKLENKFCSCIFHEIKIVTKLIQEIKRVH
jgi:hypothetical protein